MSTKMIALILILPTMPFVFAMQRTNPITLDTNIEERERIDHINKSMGYGIFAVLLSCSTYVLYSCSPEHCIFNPEIQRKVALLSGGSVLLTTGMCIHEAQKALQKKTVQKYHPNSD